MTSTDCAMSAKSEWDSIRKLSPHCTENFDHSYDLDLRCGILRARRSRFLKPHGSLPRYRSKNGKLTATSASRFFWAYGTTKLLRTCSYLGSQHEKYQKGRICARGIVN